MIDVRVIPCLLLLRGGLVKTRRFAEPKYVGDPLNAVRTFNEKGVDELMFLDIGATPSGREPDMDVIKGIAAECFMPFAYGGGITTVDQAGSILSSGVEKVVLNNSAFRSPRLIRGCADSFGSQAVVVSIDVKTALIGRYSVRACDAKFSIPAIEHAKRAADHGAGEILLTSVDREGTGSGYDTNLIAEISSAVDIPVIANGGAGSAKDFRKAVDAGAAAVSAGSLFVFYGKHRAVLITYPDRQELAEVFRD